MTETIRILQRRPYPDQDGLSLQTEEKGTGRVVIAPDSLVEDLITSVSEHPREMGRIIKGRCNKNVHHLMTA